MAAGPLAHAYHGNSWDAWHNLCFSIQRIEFLDKKKKGFPFPSNLRGKGFIAIRLEVIY